MAVRRRSRPHTSVTPSGPFAAEDLELELLLPAAAGTKGNGTNGNGNGNGAGCPAAPRRLVPVAMTWLRRRGDHVRKDQELATVRCRLGEAEVTRKLLAPRTGTLEEALNPALPPPEDGDAAPPRLVLGRVVYCTHPCLRDDRMCAVCGEVAPDLGNAHHGEGGTTRVFVQGGHHVSVSKVSRSGLVLALVGVLEQKNPYP